MKKLILVFIIPLLLGISNVSADETGTGTNSAPVAVDDVATTDEDVQVEVDLISNDTDVDEDILTITSISNILNGEGVITSSGVIFTPDTDFNGEGSFDYIISDGDLTDEGSVVITINPVNDGPVAVDDVVTTDEDIQVEIDLTSNDTDIDEDNLTVTSVSSVLNGTVVIASSGTGVIFTPNSGFIGAVSFDYKVSDGELEDTGNVLVTVTVKANSAPVAVDDVATTYVDTAVDIDLVSNDTDIDEDDLTVIGVSIVLNGTLEIMSSGEGVTFTPDSGFVGTVSFDYTVSDGELEDTGNVLVTVTTETNSEPVAVDDTLETDENTSETIDPRDNDTDVDGDDLTITGVTSGSDGTVTFTSSSVTYTPDTGYEGDDSFTYTIDDGNGGTAIGTITVTVNEEDDNDDDQDDDNDYDDYDYDDYDNNYSKHRVKDIQKEYQKEFKSLQKEYKHLMRYRDSRNEYLRAKKKLRDKYFKKLKAATGPDKRYNDYEDDDDDDEDYKKKTYKKKYSYRGDSAKIKYKDIYKKKYGKKISKISESKLIIIVGKIDDMITEINDGDYSDDTKENLNTMLLALRELVLEYIVDDEDILDIDSLFE